MNFARNAILTLVIIPLVSFGQVDQKTHSPNQVIYKTIESAALIKKVCPAHDPLKTSSTIVMNDEDIRDGTGKYHDCATLEKEHTKHVSLAEALVRTKEKESEHGTSNKNCASCEKPKEKQLAAENATKLNSGETNTQCSEEVLKKNRGLACDYESGIKELLGEPFALTKRSVHFQLESGETCAADFGKAFWGNLTDTAKGLWNSIKSLGSNEALEKNSTSQALALSQSLTDQDIKDQEKEKSSFTKKVLTSVLSFVDFLTGYSALTQDFKDQMECATCGGKGRAICRALGVVSKDIAVQWAVFKMGNRALKVVGKGASVAAEGVAKKYTKLMGEKNILRPVVTHTGKVLGAVSDKAVTAWRMTTEHTIVGKAVYQGTSKTLNAYNSITIDPLDKAANFIYVKSGGQKAVNRLFENSKFFNELDYKTTSGSKGAMLTKEEAKEFEQVMEGKQNIEIRMTTEQMKASQEKAQKWLEKLAQKNKTKTTFENIDEAETVIWKKSTQKMPGKLGKLGVTENSIQILNDHEIKLPLGHGEVKEVTRFVNKNKNKITLIKTEKGTLVKNLDNINEPLLILESRKDLKLLDDATGVTTDGRSTTKALENEISANLKASAEEGFEPKLKEVIDPVTGQKALEVQLPAKCNKKILIKL